MVRVSDFTPQWDWKLFTKKFLLWYLWTMENYLTIPCLINVIFTYWIEFMKQYLLNPSSSNKHIWWIISDDDNKGVISSVQFSSVQFSHSVMSDSLRPCESQHARPPCPSPTPGVHSDSRTSSQWCHPAISSSVVPLSFCPQSLPASETFPMSQLFAWGGQSTGVSALASFLPKKSQGWSPSKRTGWISLQSKGLSRVFSNTTVQKHQFFGT